MITIKHFIKFCKKKKITEIKPDNINEFRIHDKHIDHIEWYRQYGSIDTINELNPSMNIEDCKPLYNYIMQTYPGFIVQHTL